MFPCAVRDVSVAHREQRMDFSPQIYSWGILMFPCLNRFDGFYFIVLKRVLFTHG